MRRSSAGTPQRTMTASPVRPQPRDHGVIDMIVGQTEAGAAED